MVGPMKFSRQLGSFMSSKKKNTSEQSLDYSEMLEDDEESFYEEVIVDEDGEEYIEEVIEEEEEEEELEEDATLKSLNDLRATQEQVDSMSLKNAKKYILALPQAKGPTSAPVTYSEEDYEYEEIEMVDTITPIRRSRRSTFFEPPALDDILEGSEHTERSGASSLMQSPSASKRKQPLTLNLSNITEGSENSHNYSGELPPRAHDDTATYHRSKGHRHAGGNPSRIENLEANTPQDPDGERMDEIVKGENSTQAVTDSRHPREGKIMPGDLNDMEGTRTKLDPVPASPMIKPSISNRSISRSNKSIQSEATEPTTSESGSNTSLDIRQIFGLVTPPGSPRTSPSSRKNRASTPMQPNSNSRGGDSSLARNLKGLGESGHSNGRRSSGSSKQRDDGDSHSVMSSRSRRGSRRSSGQSSKIPHGRTESVEAEIMAILSPEQKKSSLDAMLSSPSFQDHRDSDDHSRSARSCRSATSRRRSSRVASSNKSHVPSKNPDVHKLDDKRTHGRSDSRSSQLPGSPSKHKSSSEKEDHSSKAAAALTKGVLFKEKPTLREGSKTLDALLARVPSEPTRRSDARSTVSATLRSSRGRARDGDRDCRSVVGSSSTQRTPRARSARRTKKGDDDEVSVASMSAIGRRTRTRSTSLGRKERLRRSRRMEEADRANRKHKEEMEASESFSRKEEMTSSQRSTSETHRPISGRSSSSREKDDISSSSRSEKDHLSSSHRGTAEKPKPSTDRSTPSRGSSSRVNTVEDERIEMSASRGSLSRDNCKSRTVRNEEGHTRRENTHEHSTRSSARRSTNSSSKGGQEGRRSSKPSEDSINDMDSNASFHRTLLLARSLHSSDDGSVGQDRKSPDIGTSPTNVKSLDTSARYQKSATKEVRKETGSSGKAFQDGATRIPRPSNRSEMGNSKSGDHDLRKKEGKSLITNDFLSVDSGQDSGRQNLRLSDVANAMQEVPKTPKTPRDHPREPPSKKHSSDDVLLMPPDDLDYTRTPSGRTNRTLPSRSQSSRTGSGSGRQERRVPYHSPHTPRKTLVSPSPSLDEHSHMHLARSRSEGTPKPESPTKMLQMRHRRRTSEIKPISPLPSFSSPKSKDLQSPTTSTTPPNSTLLDVKARRRSSIDMHSPSSSASPVVTPGRAMRRSSMEMHSPPSASSSSSRRRDSMEMMSSCPPLAPSLSVGPTPFERLSELEKIKQFLTAEEYEHKKKEILACI